MNSFSDLRFFCEYIVNKYGSPNNASEDDKAEEFRSIYLHNLRPNLRTLKAVASACGINLNSLEAERLPQNLRGYHEVFNGKRNIYYRKNDTISGIENTILHEFREMILPRYALAMSRSGQSRSTWLPTVSLQPFCFRGMSSKRKYTRPVLM